MHRVALVYCILRIRDCMLRATLGIVLLVALAISGCFDSADPAPHGPEGHHTGGNHHHTNGDGEGPGNMQSTGTEAYSFVVVGGIPSEFRFSPPTLEVKSGQRVAVEFDNQGAIEHEFSIESIGFHLHVDAGDRKQSSFLAPPPGEYVIGCYLPGHFEAGMKGTLIVV